MTQFPDLFAALAAPFDSREVRERDADRGGQRKLKYVTSGTVKNRLDAVLGRENWRPGYKTLGVGAEDVAVECRLAIRLPDGSKAVSVDAGQGKDFKAAYSDALKRAAEGFGVGRYLRPCGPPRPAAESAPPAREVVPPAQARPDRAEPAPSPSPSPAGGAPAAGGSFFRWAKETGERHGVNLANYLNEWGKRRGYPPRLKDWSKDQVVAAIHEAERKLGSIAGDAREPEPELVGAGVGAGSGRNGYHRNGNGRG